MKEYEDYDAIGLADLVARREVSAEELLDAALARADALNPAINAIVRMLDGEARAAIRNGLPQGPLSGVPYLIKDISAPMKGVPTSMGSKVFANIPAEADSALVRNLRAAGLVLFGKTNTPELGLAATTEGALFGPTRNPWDLSRSSGGSSGGAAAAVASRIVPAAQASDGGGSIRIPSACCGMFGLKPSRGRVSMEPAGQGWGSLSVLHAITRSVRDSALLLDIVCKPEPGDPYWVAPPSRPFVEQVSRDPGKLRIGFTTAALIWGVPEPQCVRAVRQTAALCESLGHSVEETVIPGNFQMMAMAVNTLVSSSIAELLDREGERRGAPIREDEVERLTWASYQAGRAMTGAQSSAALQSLHLFGRTLSSVFEKYDVILLSTLGRLPVPLGWMDTNAADLTPYGERIYSFMPNTQPFNAAGLPAMSVPLAWSDEGLPIGLQFAAAHGNEALLFRLAGQLEKAQPWTVRRPALTAQQAERKSA